jgi:hypothetical protein
MSENNLKPCPFCGGEARKIKPSCPAHEDCGLWGIKCANCKIIIEDETFYGAWSRWNTRSNDFAKDRTSLLKLARKWEKGSIILGTSNDFVDKEAARELKECAKQLRKALAELK